MRSTIAVRFAALTPFAVVTSLAAMVIALTAVLDLITGSVDISPWWVLLCATLGLIVAVLPIILNDRFPPAIALAACYVFIGVTSLQVSLAENMVMLVNNLVLYPMVACYLGWFFSRRNARLTAAFMFTLSGCALYTTHQPQLFTTWTNLVLASLFCLEAAVYLRSRVDRQIETDPLTGALNRIGLDRRLSFALQRGAASGRPLVVAIVDLDRFKAVNDQFGHAVGDQKLVDLVAEFDRSSRQRDSIARVGGDEFVMLLPDTALPDAKLFLERVRAGSNVAWTYGVVQAQPSDTSKSVVSRADQDLYAHKRGPAESQALGER